LSFLIHKLINTNHQNHKFSGKSALWLSCQIKEESWNHVFTCGSQGPMENRKTSIIELQKNLATINTPVALISAITHGMEMWERSQDIHALTVGSLHGSHVLLTAAFTEQFHSIGWHHLLMGRLNKYWGAAVASFREDPKDASIPLCWTAQAITFLWKYRRTEWNYRNTVVHGSNDQEMAAIIKKASTNKVREYYNTYRTTPTFILPHHHYLFTSCSLDQRLKLDIDSLNCWICSVENAIQALIHHNNQQIQQSAHYFAPFLLQEGTTKLQLHQNLQTLNIQSLP
jgi:hypothetical protein